MFSLSYKVTHKTKRESGQCGGIWFNTEQEANEYMDIVAKDWFILEMNLVEKERTSRPRTIIATTRSWE